ncbi:hypothetical protein OIB37_23735 [Streptomyces sp. NBC_00820]|uniref:hypothetical protein n=1 Tax=Streptomyces sp. NBC_00820 TaxID=2975842 RepID=UPI002ED29861|nr:hypothetical protein OIB37_23735 [Streptomyces sp. NBC_00820]
MHILLVVGAALILAVYVAVGVAAVVSEWVPPLARRRVLWSRMWGYGALLSALGLGLFLFLGPLGRKGFSLPPLLGWAVWMVGMLVQYLARRPHRMPEKTTS